MSNYSALSAHELDKLVAERLGWTDIEETTAWRDDENTTYEAVLWQGRLRGSFGYIPEYSTDANAALTLPLDDPRRWLQLESGAAGIHAGKWVCQIVCGAWVETKAEADTPARAIVLAWLAWKGA